MTRSALFSHLDKMETGNQCVKFIDLLVEHGYLTLRWFCPLSNINPFFLINMQVTNSATIVDYFPEAFVAEADDTKGMKVVVKRFIKRVTFRANNQKSYSTVVASDARYDWQSRINNGATVTDFNTDKLPSDEYMPMACVGWIMSFVSNFINTELMQTVSFTDMNTQQMFTAREQLMEDILSIVDGYLENVDIDDVDKESMVESLCDAVCHNFPS